MPRAGFEQAIPATERPQTYALDRAATGIDGGMILAGKKRRCNDGINIQSLCIILVTLKYEINVIYNLANAIFYTLSYNS
jgi:hypothetical protein